MHVSSKCVFLSRAVLSESQYFVWEMTHCQAAFLTAVSVRSSPLTLCHVSTHRLGIWCCRNFMFLPHVHSCPLLYIQYLSLVQKWWTALDCVNRILWTITHAKILEGEFKWEKIFYLHSDREIWEIFVQHFAGREVSCGPENTVTVSACYCIPVWAPVLSAVKYAFFMVCTYILKTHTKSLYFCDRTSLSVKLLSACVETKYIHWLSKM